MKRIKVLANPTDGLLHYRGQPDVNIYSWPRFYNYDGSRAYRELRDALVSLQHGLCAYCEIDLVENDRQVEHVIPRNAVPEQTLDYRNMIACCRGGSAENQFGPAVLNQYRDEDRSLPPGNISCGQAKDERTGALDPRMLPTQPSLFRVRSNGEIEADDDACNTAGIPADKVRETIKILGLNVRRLRQAREKHRRALGDEVRKILSSLGNVPPETRLRNMAHERLLPNGNGTLRRFFTTERSFFSRLGGERILAEPPQSWI